MAANVANLTSTYALATKLMDEFGLADQGWTFDFAKDKRTVGWCHHEAKRIAYSMYFLHNSPKEIEDTIRHEIAHALCPPIWNERTGKWVSHGSAWKNMAIKVGARPQRCAAPQVKASARYNYVIKCSACNKETGRKYRLKRALLANYRSKCCGAVLNAYRLTYKEGVSK